MRRRFLFGATGLLAGAVVILPAVAGSETSPSIKAENLGGGINGETHAWTPRQVTVGEGATVALSNPTAVPHGVRWISPPATPACAGVPVGTTETDSAREWSGTCTFTTPGTYFFYCTVHGAAMSGTVTVNGPTITDTSTQPSTPGPTSTGPSGAGEPGSANTLGGGASGSPLAGSASRAVKLASSQHGKSVHGSVNVSQAGAHGRLEVDLLARNASLARVAHPTQVHVGKIVRSSLAAGTVSFSVPLSARAKSVLKRKGHLALTVKVVLKPASGSAVTVARVVLMRR